MSFMHTNLCQCLSGNELEKYTQIQDGSCARNRGELEGVRGGNLNIENEGEFNFISTV